LKGKRKSGDATSRQRVSRWHASLLGGLRIIRGLIFSNFNISSVNNFKSKYYYSPFIVCLSHIFRSMSRFLSVCEYSIALCLPDGTSSCLKYSSVWSFSWIYSVISPAISIFSVIIRFSHEILLSKLLVLKSSKSRESYLAGCRMQDFREF
jgi:hypothetical protein